MVGSSDDLDDNAFSFRQRRRHFGGPTVATTDDDMHNSTVGCYEDDAAPYPVFMTPASRMLAAETGRMLRSLADDVSSVSASSSSSDDDDDNKRVASHHDHHHRHRRHANNREAYPRQHPTPPPQQASPRSSRATSRSPKLSVNYPSRSRRNEPPAQNFPIRPISAGNAIRYDHSGSPALAARRRQNRSPAGDERPQREYDVVDMSLSRGRRSGPDNRVNLHTNTSQSAEIIEQWGDESMSYRNVRPLRLAQDVSRKHYHPPPSQPTAQQQQRLSQGLPVANNDMGEFMGRLEQLFRQQQQQTGTANESAGAPGGPPVGNTNSKSAWDSLATLVWDALPGKPQQITSTHQNTGTSSPKYQSQQHQDQSRHHQNVEMLEVLSQQQVQQLRSQRQRELELQKQLNEKDAALQKVSAQVASLTRKLKDRWEMERRTKENSDALVLEKASLIERLRRVDAERAEQEMAISRSNLALEDINRQMVLLRSELLDSRRELRLSHDKLRRVEIRYFLSQCIRRKFGAHRVDHCRSQNVVLSLAPFPATPGGLSLVISSPDASVNIEMTHITNVRIFPGRKISMDETLSRLRLDTSLSPDNDLLEFELQEGPAACQCYMLLKLLIDILDAQRSYQGYLGGPTSISALGSFFFGSRPSITSVPSHVPTAPENFADGAALSASMLMMLDRGTFFHQDSGRELQSGWDSSSMLQEKLPQAMSPPNSWLPSSKRPVTFTKSSPPNEMFYPARQDASRVQDGRYEAHERTRRYETRLELEMLRESRNKRDQSSTMRSSRQLPSNLQLEGSTDTASTRPFEKRKRKQIVTSRPAISSTEESMTTSSSSGTSCTGRRGRLRHRRRKDMRRWRKVDHEKDDGSKQRNKRASKHPTRKSNIYRRANRVSGNDPKAITRNGKPLPRRTQRRSVSSSDRPFANDNMSLAGFVPKGKIPRSKNSSTSTEWNKSEKALLRKEQLNGKQRRREEREAKRRRPPAVDLVRHLFHLPPSAENILACAATTRVEEELDVNQEPLEALEEVLLLKRSIRSSSSESSDPSTTTRQTSQEVLREAATGLVPSELLTGGPVIQTDQIDSLAEPLGISSNKSISILGDNIRTYCSEQEAYMDPEKTSILSTPAPTENVDTRVSPKDTTTSNDKANRTTTLNVTDNIRAQMEVTTPADEVYQNSSGSVHKGLVVPAPTTEEHTRVLSADENKEVECHSIDPNTIAVRRRAVPCLIQSFSDVRLYSSNHENIKSIILMISDVPKVVLYDVIAQTAHVLRYKVARQKVKTFSDLDHCQEKESINAKPYGNILVVNAAISYANLDALCWDDEPMFLWTHQCYPHITRIIGFTDQESDSDNDTFALRDITRDKEEQVPTTPIDLFKVTYTWHFNEHDNVNCSYMVSAILNRAPAHAMEVLLRLRSFGSCIEQMLVCPRDLLCGVHETGLDEYYKERLRWGLCWLVSHHLLFLDLYSPSSNKEQRILTAGTIFHEAVLRHLRQGREASSQEAAKRVLVI